MIATPLRQSPPLHAAPRILLTATLRWPIAARLAIAFAEMGCRVVALCPKDHPVTKARSIRRTYHYPLLKPLAALRAAIESAAPDLIVPCDDSAAVHLQQLFLQADLITAAALRKLIARSLGVPEACSLATERGRFIALAGEEGVRVPSTAVVATQSDLDAWLATHGVPAVIKTDSSCGGQGVSVVRTREEARRAFDRMAERPSVANALARMLLERDGSYLFNSLRKARPAITVQRFIVGMPANRAVACWEGEVLAGISVQALETQHPTGPATVVRVIDHAEMAESVKRLVRRLGISGLWGVDFVLHESGAAYVIEMNPRATPICHLPLGPGSNLLLALYTRLTGVAPDFIPAAIDHDVIAMFPGEWHRNSASQYLRTGYHDIPWDEPELIQDCIDKPWSERGAIARLRSMARRISPHRSARTVRVVDTQSPERVRRDLTAVKDSQPQQLQPDGERVGP